MRGPLTDRKIAAYQKQGWYSQAMKDARRELWARKASKVKAQREGQFVRQGDGRMIYSPL